MQEAEGDDTTRIDPPSGRMLAALAAKASAIGDVSLITLCDAEKLRVYNIWSELDAACMRLEKARAGLIALQEMAFGNGNEISARALEFVTDRVAEEVNAAYSQADAARSLASAAI